MAWSKSNPINFAADGDTTGEAIEKFILELTSVYAFLNRLRTLDKGGTAPADPDTDSVWLDDSGASVVIKYYDGASWLEIPLNATTFNGQSASYYQIADASDILTKILTVDGTGSGLDADTVDGIEGAALALLASPAFTGNPTAPTQSTSNNSTRIATTAYVRALLNSQSWSNLTASRAIGTTYTNTTGLPIHVSANVTTTTNLVGSLRLTVGGYLVNSATTQGGTGYEMGVTGVVPNGVSYVVSTEGSGLSYHSWYELR